MKRSNTTVRISKESRDNLKQMAEMLDATMSEIANKAIERYRRKLFIKKANESYARLKEENPESWNEMIKEREEWDSTLSDGLEETD